MDILIIFDNISQNYKWCNTFNTIKRWIIYWLNNIIIKKNLKSLTIGKTYPNPLIIRLENDELKIENIIDLFDSIIVKKTQIYECINIKYIFDMCCNNNKIIIKDDKSTYLNIFVFSSILELILADNHQQYIKDCLINNKIVNIKFVNFAYKKCLPINSKIIEKIINPKYVNNYELYVEISQLLNLSPTKNNFNNQDSNINEIFEKLFEIEFENYKKSHWSETSITNDVGIIYSNYIEILNQQKNSNFENMSGSCINFIKYCINWVRIKLLEKFNNINFNIPQPIITSDLTSDYILEIIKFYDLVYTKILSHRITKSKKKSNFNLKKINLLDFSDIKLTSFQNDDSTNYLYSNTTMTNWKQEYEHLNPFGLILKYTPHNLSYKGIFECNILTTYPNIMISSISNNWLSLFDYYQLILADIDISTKNSFCVNDYVFVDNLHGDSNIMLPIYINSEHWKLVKKYWSHHISFINEAFEFDYIKKMDNIYFMTIIKTINLISSIKCNQNIIRLFIYILRTSIQICIDNKYSYNNKANYDNYFNLLLNTKDLQSFNNIFIDYLIRIIQSILTSNIKIQELNDDIDKLIVCFIKHLIIFDETVNIDLIKDMNYEEKIKKIEEIEEKINLNILCFYELKKDLNYFWNLMNKIYSIKKFNQLIKYLDNNNGCLPLIEDELNCEIIKTIINKFNNESQSNIVLDIKSLIKNTGLIVI